ncbi:MAG: helix-turn-helix domain-containing protein [Terriglobia bacterium]
MGTFGENLRRERELRGITLPELASATKINLRTLRALEQDQFDQLPGGVFNRGFVRAVARYMNLDEHFWVGEFVQAAHEEPEVLARYAPPGSILARSGRRGMGSFALLLVVFGAGAYMVHELRLRSAAEASPPVVLAPESVTAPAPESAARPLAARPHPAAESAPEASAQTLAPGPDAMRVAAAASELQLQIDVLEEAWVSVAVDGQPHYRGLMKPGETRRFRGRHRIELTTGNASAVVLTLNGETLAPLGDPGERRSVTLTAEDLISYNP